MSRNSILLVALLSLGLPATGGAGETPRAIAGKPAAKLLGAWRSAQGTIAFRTDGIAVYKGRRYHYAAGNGAIQLKNRKVFRQLPYRIFDDKLTVTDNGVDTVYTRD
ncbi:MAG TPA: hypothetical protein VFF26_04895 [Gallionella sp.]|nr:hypothetical protein [Gallionella sp.]